MFTVYDYIVLTLMLAISACIGIFYAYRGRKTETTSDYLLGGRKMSVIPTAISSMATIFSANGLMGFPVEMYRYGTQISMMILALPLFILTTAHAYLPVFYDLRVTSAFEYLEKRFSKGVRTLASTIYCLGSMVFMTVVIYAPSLALAHVTGIDMWTCIISVTAVATFYTFLGGLKAVIWTDVFQASVMFVSVLTVLIMSFRDEGGAAKVWGDNRDGGRIEFFNLNLDPRIRYTLWGVTIGKYTTFLALFATNPLLVQRCLSVPSLKQARRVLYVNTPPYIIIIAICCLLGMVIYSRYRNCDLMLSKQVQKPDEMIPFLVMDVMGQYPGFPGLFVAGLLSAALSTVSSMQNTLSTLVLEDFIKVYVAPNITDIWSRRLCRALVIAFGCFGVAGVFLAKFMGQGIFQITGVLYGMIPTPILGLFTLGMFFPWVNTKGAVCGFLTGVAFVCWIGFGSYIAKPYDPQLPVSIAGCIENITVIETASSNNNDIFGLYLISFVWYGPLSIGIILFVGLFVSFITGPNSLSKVDPVLLSPVFHKIANLLNLSGKDDFIQEVDDSYDSLLDSKWNMVVCNEECKDYVKLKPIVSKKF